MRSRYRHLGGIRRSVEDAIICRIDSSGPKQKPGGGKLDQYLLAGIKDEPKSKNFDTVKERFDALFTVPKKSELLRKGSELPK